MPYEIVKDTGRCPVSKPWAVVSTGSGETKGCHATKKSAREQQKAIYANTESEYALSREGRMAVDAARAQEEVNAALEAQNQNEE